MTILNIIIILVFIFIQTLLRFFFHVVYNIRDVVIIISIIFSTISLYCYCSTLKHKYV